MEEGQSDGRKGRTDAGHWPTDPLEPSNGPGPTVTFAIASLLACASLPGHTSLSVPSVPFTFANVLVADS